MTFKHYIISAFAAIFLFAAGCDKEKVPAMSATVDGAQWAASPVTVLGATPGDYTTILGVSTDGKKILLAIKGTAPGTYTLNPLEAGIDQVSFYLTDEDAADDDTKKYVSTNGEVTITDVSDNRLSGTFRFTGLNSLDDAVEITEGTFSNVLYL